MIFTKKLLDSTASHGPSGTVEVAGSSLILHLTVTAVGGNGAIIWVETSFDGDNWSRVFSVTASADMTADGTASAPVAAKFIRVNFDPSGTSTVTATLTAFE